jgi:ABC-type sugar transport system substrate-binding protein
MRSVRWIVPACVAAVALLACCGSDDDESGGGSAAQSEPVRIGMVVKGLEYPFFQDMKDGAEAAAREHGADLEVQAASAVDDASGQAAKLEALVGQQMDCYVVNPVSETNLVQPLARVEDGTPIVNIDLPVGGDAAQEAGLTLATYIGTDNVAAGALGADTMAELVDKGASIGIIGGTSGDPTSAARIDGFTENAGGRFTALQTVAADWDRAKALTAAEDLLRAQPELGGFFAANDGMALGIAQAVRNAGKEGDVAVIGVDGTQDAMKSIKNRGMAATVAQYPYTIGQLGVEACLAAVSDETLPAKVDAPVQVVTGDNVAQAEQNFPEPVEAFDNPFGG